VNYDLYFSTDSSITTGDWSSYNQATIVCPAGTLDGYSFNDNGNTVNTIVQNVVVPASGFSGYIIVAAVENGLSIPCSSVNGFTAFVYPCTSTPTPTFTNTATNSATQTPSQTATNTATNTNTNTSTQTATNSATMTATNTPNLTFTNTRTATNTSTNTSTNTATQTATQTATNTATQTATNSATNTCTNTNTNTFTQTATNTATTTVTQTFTNTATMSATNTATLTPFRTATPTITNTITYTPTLTPSPSVTPVATMPGIPVYQQSSYLGSQSMGVTGSGSSYLLLPSIVNYAGQVDSNSSIGQCQVAWVGSFDGGASYPATIMSVTITGATPVATWANVGLAYLDIKPILYNLTPTNTVTPVVVYSIVR